MKQKPEFSLVAKYMNKECTAKEKEEFEKWLGLNNENQNYFNQLKEAWDAYGADRASFIPDKTKAWERIDSKITQKTTRQKQIVMWSVRIAASILVILGLYIVLNLFGNTKDITLIAATTLPDEVPRELLLSDGTIVWLNQSTSLRYPDKFSNKARTVYLNGEAYFEVSKDEKKPFLIKTSNTVTEVLGTSFNLRAYDAEKIDEIVVNTGRVAFYSKDDTKKQLILSKGHAGQFDIKNNLLVESEEMDENYNSWKTGKLLFYKASLADVCNTLERHYNKKIIITDDTLKQMVLSATYDNQSFEEVIDYIAETLEIQFYRQNDSLLFSPN